MWKPETNNKTLPTRLPLMEEQQKETQYPGWHKDTTGKGLWSKKDNEDIIQCTLNFKSIC